jgi:hypothetical protein
MKNWPDQIKQIERQFVWSVDVEFFTKAAFLQSATADFQVDEFEALCKRLQIDANEAREKLAETADTLIHQFRYFQAEKMLSLLLAGARFDLTLRSVSLFKGNFWQHVLPDLASEKVPAQIVRIGSRAWLPRLGGWRAPRRTR